MSTVRVSKIKIRRGSDNQRKFMVFDQGELVYTTDTKRLFVGTGTLSGGNVVGSKIHPLLNNYYSLSTINAQIGDIVNVNNKFYQLTATNYSNTNSWADVGLKINATLFQYDSSNNLNLVNDSISAIFINSETVTNGLKIEDGYLQSNYNTRNFQISAYQITLNSGGVNETEINSSSLGRGLSGGSGEKLTLNLDPRYLSYSGNSLTLTNIPLYVDDTTIVKDLTGGIYTKIDGVSIISTDDGLSVQNDAVSGTNQLAQITVDQFGRVTNQVSSIYGALTGNSSLSSLNVSNSLSSIFNGTPSQSLSGGITGLQVARFTATDINGYTVTLSSAGFITFEGPTTTRTGQRIGRFAIPIFAY